MPPTPMMSSTTDTLTATMTALTRADSWMPTTSSTVAASAIRMAGRLTIAVAVEPSGRTTGGPRSGADERREA